MAKKNAAYIKQLSWYSYLARAYGKFILTGKCLDFPAVLQLQTQSFCNGRCIICPYPTVSKKLEQGTMEWDLFQKIADEAATQPLFRVTFYELHNEPLLDKRIFDCIKYFKSKNDQKSHILVTNGELLDRFSSAELVQSNLDGILVSLNAHSRVIYETVNLGLDYDRVMQNISHLLSDKTLRPKLTLSFVAIEQNSLDVLQAIKYWTEVGVRTRVISEISNRGGTLENYEHLKLRKCYGSPNLLSQFRMRFMNGARRVIGCHLPFYQMNILFNGDVIVCCHDWKRATVIGNVRTSHIRHIWNSEKMNSIRKKILKKEYGRIESCMGCSLATRA